MGSSRDDRLLTQKELAAVLSITDRQVRTLTDKRILSTENLGARVLYPLAPCVRQFVEYRCLLVVGSAEARSAKNRKIEADAKLAEITVARAEALLIPIEVHRTRLADVLDRLRSRIIAAPGAWAPRLVGITSVAAAIKRLKPLTAELIATLSTVADDLEAEDLKPEAGP